MKYLYDVPFSTPAATDSYRSGWEAVFGKKARGTMTVTSVDRDAPTLTCDPAPFQTLLREDEDNASRFWANHLAPGDDCPCASGKAFARCHGLDPADE